MYSISFPDMFTGSKVRIVADHDATLQNLRLLLLSEKTALFGDPYYGTKLKKMLYDQNSPLLADILIDEIYTCIVQFMPQLMLTRNDIKIEASKDTVKVTISCINLLDHVNDLFTINLTE